MGVRVNGLDQMQTDKTMRSYYDKYKQEFVCRI